jgi:hypothetical protein
VAVFGSGTDEDIQMLEAQDGTIAPAPAVAASHFHTNVTLLRRLFRVTPYSVDWCASDGTSLVECLSNPMVRRESYLDALAIRVIRIEPTTDSLKSIQDRLEDGVQRLAFRFDYRDAEADPEDDDEDWQEHGLTPRFERLRRPWVKRRDGVTSLRLSVQGACDALGSYVSKLSPPFVSASYDIRVVPLHPDEWEANDGRHLVVRLQPHGLADGFDLEDASSGIASWTRFALSEALRLVEADAADIDLPPLPTRDELLLVDYGDGPESVFKGPRCWG